jgi:probable rRNA maturation factor
MLRAIDLGSVELSVALTDDVEIRELNGVFRQRDKATDVLAFAMREGEPLGGGATVAPGSSGEILGDVVISVETARRQAKEHGRTLSAELQMLLAHGLLHLIGYDHRTKREEIVMNGATDRLCRAARSAKSSAAIRDVGKNGDRQRTAATGGEGSRAAVTKRGATRGPKRAAAKRNSATKRRARRSD